MNQNVNDIIYKRVAYRMGVSEAEVRAINTLMWKFIREKITSIDFQSITSQEEYNKYKMSFMIPDIGRLYATYDHIKNVNYCRNRRNEHKENQTTIHEPSNNNG